jgi:hypothetical protein
MNDFLNNPNYYWYLTGILFGLFYVSIGVGLAVYFLTKDRFPATIDEFIKSSATGLYFIGYVVLLALLGLFASVIGFISLTIIVIGLPIYYFVGVIIRVLNKHLVRLENNLEDK